MKKRLGVGPFKKKQKKLINVKNVLPVHCRQGFLFLLSPSLPTSLGLFTLISHQSTSLPSRELHPV